jgi:hypothetical protein
MHYPFEAGLILQPTKYANGLTPAGGLSKIDKEWVRHTYPALPTSQQELKPFMSERIDIEEGGQSGYQFKPTDSREYTFKTFGSSDCVVVVFEQTTKGPKYLKGVDDSGEDMNGEIRMRLEKGKSYSVQVRLLYKDPTSQLAIMVW